MTCRILSAKYNHSKVCTRTRHMLKKLSKVSRRYSVRADGAALPTIGGFASRRQGSLARLMAGAYNECSRVHCQGPQAHAMRNKRLGGPSWARALALALGFELGVGREVKQVSGPSSLISIISGPQRQSQIRPIPIHSTNF